MTKLRRVQLPYPDPKEQAVIVGYIAQAKSNFDNAINTALRELDLLGEYRSRLVADVVTGKMPNRSIKYLPGEAPARLISLWASSKRLFVEVNS